MGNEKMTARDFTLQRYRDLCEEIIGSGYRVFTVNDFLLQRPRSDFVILRHDVDSRPWMALKMAGIEKDLDIRATYYFRFAKGIFDPEIIRRIDDMGHEIGYHYEVLSRAGGNYEDAIRLFGQELEEFRKICNINTICMHGSVLSKYDNKKLWSLYNFRDFGIAAEAYLSLGNDFSYLSDTGWEWNRKHKLRDLMPSEEDNSSVNSTDDLFDIISNNKIKNIYLLVHPGNWTDGHYDWYYIFLKNKFFNAGKWLLSRARSRHDREMV
jgi:hypothetical protein